MTSDVPCCADASRAAAEPLAGTAVNATRWLLVEVPGPWPRDVSDAAALPATARDAVASWLARSAPSRLLFVRRPGRSGSSRLVFAVRAEESVTEVRRYELESLDQLATVDLESGGDRVSIPLALVCGHGSRDRCCARLGTAIFGALEPVLGDEALWISSHQGGHRFAGNVLVLPAGIQLGRVDRDGAESVTERALAGRIDLDRFRGRTCYQPRVQAADHALRVTLGLDELAALRLTRAEGFSVRFRTGDGVEHDVLVDEIEGPVVPASCGAEPEPQRMFAARVA